VARKLQVLATNDDNLGAAQDLLGDDGRKTAEQVTATVDDDSLKRYKKLN
jgi:outer membrane murein-binding lipoprotein Lpp